ncbi:MAG: arginine--tRNA ligase, partial [Bacteroidota bacterium]
MKELVVTAIAAALERLGMESDIRMVIERPRQEQHGDLTTNVAMALAKRLRKNPRELATEIVHALRLDPSLVERIDVAGPGFINVAFTPKYLRRELRALIDAGTQYGRSTSVKGKRI